MHSIIRRKIVSDVYTSKDYVIIMQCARSKPKPYNVNYLEFNYFMKLSDCYVIFIRSKKRQGDPQVHHLRELRYSKINRIEFKLSFEEACKDLPQRFAFPKEICWLPIHQRRLGITKIKYNLQSMKNVLPSNSHDFFEKLRIRISEN